MKTAFTIFQDMTDAKKHPVVNVRIKLESRIAKNTKKQIQNILDDVDSICERDPAALGRAEVLLMYSGLHAVLMYRVAHALNDKCPLTARAISQVTRFFTGIEIHPGATIGKGLFIDHGSGVVIGETTIIGDNCTIYQGVTLGGTGKETGKRHPTLGNNVMVGSGAKLLGNFTVGSNSKIASGAVVLTDIPENSTAVGVPAKVVRRNGSKVEDMDQVHIPDPMQRELDCLTRRVQLLEETLRLSIDNKKTETK